MSGVSWEESRVPSAAGALAGGFGGASTDLEAGGSLTRDFVVRNVSGCFRGNL